METSGTKEVSQKHALGIFFYPPICENKETSQFSHQIYCQSPQLSFPLLTRCALQVL